jgi:hypothetical protein
MQGKDVLTETADRLLAFFGYTLVKGKNDGKHSG